MDRCALFVDAGYMLADGAMAVHGTRRRESVTWDYEGLLELLGNLARDRTGLPLLRCYWYEATVEGRRTPEHDGLADVPGVKLRLAKLRPGRREGVDTEIHRDLTVLARNHAVSDAVVVSAEEDLAQVVSDVQDLGMRVTIVHVTVDGNWTISRSLRQESDDIMELTSAHLRPFVELIPGAEPVHADEQYTASALVRSGSNGHSASGAGSYQALPAGTGHSGPPSIYTAPVVAEYQRPVQQIAPPPPAEPAPRPPVREEPAASAPLVFGRSEAPAAPAREEPGRPDPIRAADPHTDLRGRTDRGRVEPGVAPLPSAGRADLAGARSDLNPGRPDMGRPDLGRPDMGRPDLNRTDPRLGDPRLGDLAESDNGSRGAQSAPPVRQDLYAAPVATPFPMPAAAPPAPSADEPVTRSDAGHGRPLPQNDLPARNDVGPGPSALPARGRPGPAEYPAPAEYPGRGRGADEPSGYGPASPQDQYRNEALDPHRGPSSAQPGPFRRPPSAPPAGPGGPNGPAGPGMGNGPIGAVPPAPPARPGALGPGQLPQGPQNPPGPQGGQLPSGPPASQAYVPAQNGGPYSGPQSTPAGRSGAPVSLTDAVQSAHEEGKDFGDSVAREAPALWLEAVLARKPRMPSDLEARLLQGSALPIDFLLHDEVRHALRRGFWDALESSRR
ncbi:MAG TPA: NYN domain-containing protein [Streptosporangiaceae bacterium]|nr:NYN domain-containing protein [Streptosporangiaceae bacterium]